MSDKPDNLPSNPEDASREGEANATAAPMSVRDQLFGRLVLVNGFANEATIEAARREAGSSKPLATILVDLGVITSEDREAIEVLLAHQIAKHGGDPQKSLSRISSATVSVSDPTGSDTVTYVPNAARSVDSGPSFGEYEIIEPIAEGGMGVVYKARQTKLNRLVALKMIRSGELADDEQVERFYAEARAAARLDHPGIVPVFEVGKQSGQHFFSMAFVDGVSLHERVKVEGPLAPKTAAAIMKIVAEAVQFGHSNKIIHRDIKPHNILLDKSGTPRVTDFGLARQGDSQLTVAGQIMGTPSYMPPEQAEGKQAAVGVVSDVYSLGATLYYLLTGRPPFQAASPTETLRQVVEIEAVSPRRLNPDIPRDLETICLKCLQKEQPGRYVSAQSFADDLDRWLQDKPIRARRIGPLGKTWLWCKRKPALAVSTTAILLSICFVTGFILRERQRNLFNRVETAVDAMGSARENAVPFAISALDEYPSYLVLRALREEYDASENDRKLALAYALAHHGDLRSEFLVSQVRDVSPDECENLVTALRHSTSESISAIEQLAIEAGREKNWRLKARLAMVALLLGFPSLAHEMCQSRSDPIQRTLFIDECSNWHGDTSELAKLMAKTDDDSLRFGVSLAIGGAPNTEIRNTIKQVWQPILADWYQHESSTATHSAAKWVLKKWKSSLPTVAPTKSPKNGMNWHVNSLGVTMLKIPSGSFVRRGEKNVVRGNRIEESTQTQSVTLTKSFLISDCEITRAQFQQFIDDPTCPANEKPKDWQGVRTKYSPTGNHPVERVNWYEATLFCNWISKKEGLSPCYHLKQIENKDSKIRAIWSLNPKANGYRLPTGAEWEYACRAGTTTMFGHGNNELFLGHYAVYLSSRTEPCGSKLPNGWGLFDLHGNVREWTNDRHWSYGTETELTDPMGHPTATGHELRGGQFDSRAFQIQSGSRIGIVYRTVQLIYSPGFRLARTYLFP